MCLIGSSFSQAVDELLDLPRGDLVHVEVPESCIDSPGHIFIAGLRALAKGLFHILLLPLAGEGFKLDMAVGERGSVALLLK